MSLLPPTRWRPPPSKRCSRPAQENPGDLFGEAMWVKVFVTEAAEPADLSIFFPATRPFQMVRTRRSGDRMDSSSVG